MKNPEGAAGAPNDEGLPDAEACNTSPEARGTDVHDLTDVTLAELPGLIDAGVVGDGLRRILGDVQRGPEVFED